VISTGGGNEAIGENSDVIAEVTLANPLTIRLAVSGNGNEPLTVKLIGTGGGT
jgi:hypothetical protein